MLFYRVNVDRSHRDGGFGWQDPLVRSCGCNRACSSVALRIARPKRFPSATGGGASKGSEAGCKTLAFSKIHQ